MENCSNRKVDIGSMLSQVEFRTPFLDLDVLEYVMKTNLDWRSIGKNRLTKILPKWFEPPAVKSGFSSIEREEVVESMDLRDLEDFFIQYFGKRSCAKKSLAHSSIGRRYRSVVLGKWLKRYL